MNLLPISQKKKVKLGITYQNIIFSGLILVLLILILIVFLGGFLIFLNFKYHSIEKRITVEQSRIIQTETVKGMERKIKELNKEIDKLEEFQTSQSNLYQILEKITRNLFLEVKVYSLEMDRGIGRVAVTGYSASRENLLVIKEILETSPDYKNIDFPLSNLTNPRDIDFNFSFEYEYEY